MAKRKYVDAQTRAERPGNLANKVKLSVRLFWLAAALLLGVVSSVVFAPLEWTFLAWLFLVPILVLAFRFETGQFGLGYAWGFGYNLCTLLWLKEVFLLAPVGVALICASYPAIWMHVAAKLRFNFLYSRKNDLEPRAGRQRGALPFLSPLRQIVLMLSLATLWVAFEWIRSWLFTGFPWNQLGVSQYRNPMLLALVPFTGIYGISFLIILANVGVWLLVEQVQRWRIMAIMQRVPWALLVAAGTLVVAAVLPPRLKLAPVAETVRVACVQGNIPQIRNATRQQYADAVRIYLSQTHQVCATDSPQLVVWPETAVAYPIALPDVDRDGRLQEFMVDLLRETKTPMIIGSIDIRLPASEGEKEGLFNSVIQLDKTGKRINTYDKIHIVPFGEFLPLENWWPQWLRNHPIFMRSLTRGREHTILKFEGLRIGMNICYEDVFPEISAASVHRGANVLLTVTNDAWYNETSGSHQHLTHAVFRAVETGRPMLRSGNNSDTCLILPNGQITGLLVNPRTRSPFYEGHRTYKVPIYKNLPVTFYTRHGDWLAHICTILGCLAVSWCLYRFLDRRRRILAKLPTLPEANAPVQSGGEQAE